MTGSRLGRNEKLFQIDRDGGFVTLKTQAEIALRLSPEQARLLEPDLELLGQLISSEWSKPDPVRRISSKMLTLWGTALAKACERDQRTPLLEQIRDDVSSLLQGGPRAGGGDGRPPLRPGPHEGAGAVDLLRACRGPLSSFSSSWDVPRASP